MFPKIKAVAGALVCAMVIIFTTALSTAALAQQTSAGGMSGNMNLMRILNRVKALERTTSILSEENRHLLTCQEKSMAYAPSEEKADSDGCVSILKNKKRTIVEKTLCTRNGVHELWATCPAGYTMIACSGGPGDQLEDSEGWFVTPVPEENACYLLIGNPACIAGAPWTHTHLFAHCIEN